MLRSKKKVLLALAAAALLADQAVLYTVLADDLFLGRCIAPYDPPVFKGQRDSLDSVRRAVAGDPAVRDASVFDAELGWCPRPLSTWLGTSFDALGARVGPRAHAALPAPGATRVITVGGSFTMGMEVGDAEAWPALVEATSSDLEVVNLGVPGYGIDQAYLRWRRDGRGLGAAEVWVGFMPEASLRVSTHYPPIYQWWAPMCVFKPRLLPDAEGPDGLRLVPNPARDLPAVLRLLSDQEAFVAAIGATDLWVRRTPSAFAPRGSSPLHRFASTRLALTLYEARGRDRAPWFRDSESEIFQTLLRVMVAFQDGCAVDGVRLRVLVLPSRIDLAGDAYWDGLVRELSAAGVECIDTSAALRDAGGADDPALWMRQGHYSPAGNAIVAAAILDARR